MKATATISGARIHVRTNPSVRNLKAEVPGASWNNRAGAWTFPLSMDVCRNLRQHFGSQLVVGRDLAAWARIQIAEEEAQAALGANLTGVELYRVPELAPLLQQALRNRPYQSPAARFIADGRRVLVADTPGLGKTTEALAGIVESGVPGPYLVIAPLTAGPHWAREIRERLPHHRAIHVDGVGYRRHQTLSFELDSPFSQDRSWIIINIEMVRTRSFWVCPSCNQRWKASDKPKQTVVDCGDDPRRVRTETEHDYPELFGVEWGAIIADESHRSLLRTSGTPTQTRAGMKLLESAPGGLRIAMSGTPMRGKPQRLWGTLNWLRPEEYTGYWSWTERFWEVTTGGFAGARMIGDFQDGREQAFNASLAKIMIRRTKAEVQPHLPRKAYMGTLLDPEDADSPVAVWLPMTEKQQKAYDAMAESGSSEVDGGQLDAVGILAEMTRMKQFANAFGGFKGREYSPSLPSNKFDWVVQFLTERNMIDGDEAPTGKVVIASHFTQLLNLFAAELRKMDVPYVMVTGEVTGHRRQNAIDVFNDLESDTRVMFLNTQAGGVGITLDAADDMIILDETHVPDEQEQLEDRIDNRRPEERVAQRCYWYVKSLGTIEEAIARVNSMQDRLQKQHLDDRRGIAYLREVYATLDEMKKGKA